MAEEHYLMIMIITDMDDKRLALVQNPNRIENTELFQNDNNCPWPALARAAPLCPHILWSA